MEESQRELRQWFRRNRDKEKFTASECFLAGWDRCEEMILNSPDAAEKIRDIMWQKAFAGRTDLRCPIDGTRIMVYDYHLRSGHTKILGLLYVEHLRNGFERFVEVSSWVNNKEEYDIKGTVNNWTMVRHWDLVETRVLTEEEAGEKKKPTSSGLWRLSEKGRLFVEEKISVESNALVFLNRLVRLKGDPITFRQALKAENFNWTRLMRGISEA